MHRNLSVRALCVSASVLLAQAVAWPIAIVWTQSGDGWWQLTCRAIAVLLLTVAVLAPALVLIVIVVPPGTPVSPPPAPAPAPRQLPAAPPRVVQITVQDLPRSRTPSTRTPIGG